MDAAAFDPEHHLAFISAGAGKLTILFEDDKGFHFRQEVTTEPGARTLGLDQKTGQVFLPIAKFEPASSGQKRRAITPGTFSLIVVSP